MKKKVIGVKFNTRSEKYKNKNYYYLTNKEVKKGERIQVQTRNSMDVPCIVSNNDYKGKLSKNRKYKTY